jgi:hypothetical protein
MPCKQAFDLDQFPPFSSLILSFITLCRNRQAGKYPVDIDAYQSGDTIDRASLINYSSGEKP